MAVITQEYEKSDIQLYLGINSRYSDNPVFKAGENLILNTFEKPIYTSATDDSYFTVIDKYQGRLDLISAAVYGTTELWWLIAYTNNILDPFTEVVAGTQLVIPPASEARNKEIL